MSLPFARFSSFSSPSTENNYRKLDNKTKSATSFHWFAVLEKSLHYPTVNPTWFYLSNSKNPPAPLCDIVLRFYFESSHSRLSDGPVLVLSLSSCVTKRRTPSKCSMSITPHAHRGKPGDDTVALWERFTRISLSKSLAITLKKP